jgi:hypothetical protein
MSRKNDKDIGSSNLINRFSLLTSDGRKKNAQESKKKDAKDVKENKSVKTKTQKSHNVQNTNVTQHRDSNNFEILDKDNFFDDDLQKKILELENGSTDNNLKDRDDSDGKNNYLNSQWTVWVHRNYCEDWTVASYKNIFLIDSIGSFWEFFNNFHKINKEDNQYFIMRNKIKPIWEDNNNRKGGICSLKMDCYDKNGKSDIGSEIMICLCILIMNETFIQENSEINGISYSIKNKSIYIKIWTKDFKNDISSKLPKNLITKFNNVIRSNMFKKFDNNISVRYTPIQPEYEDTNQEL